MIEDENVVLNSSTTVQYVDNLRPQVISLKKKAHQRVTAKSSTLQRKNEVPPAPNFVNATAAARVLLITLSRGILRVCVCV
jgi:hypothetical protein